MRCSLARPAYHKWDVKRRGKIFPRPLPRPEAGELDCLLNSEWLMVARVVQPIYMPNVTG